MACQPASSADQEAEHEGAVFSLLSDNLHGAARLQVWSEFRVSSQGPGSGWALPRPREPPWERDLSSRDVHSGARPPWSSLCQRPAPGSQPPHPRPPMRPVELCGPGGHPSKNLRSFSFCCSEREEACGPTSLPAPVGSLMSSVMCLAPFSPSGPRVSVCEVSCCVYPCVRCHAGPSTSLGTVSMARFTKHPMLALLPGVFRDSRTSAPSFPWSLGGKGRFQWQSFCLTSASISVPVCVPVCEVTETPECPLFLSEETEPGFPPLPSPAVDLGTHFASLNLGLLICEVRGWVAPHSSVFPFEVFACAVTSSFASTAALSEVC